MTSHVHIHIYTYTATLSHWFFLKNCNGILLKLTLHIYCIPCSVIDPEIKPVLLFVDIYPWFFFRVVLKLYRIRRRPDPDPVFPAKVLISDPDFLIMCCVSRSIMSFQIVLRSARNTTYTAGPGTASSQPPLAPRLTDEILSQVRLCPLSEWIFCRSRKECNTEVSI